VEAEIILRARSAASQRLSKKMGFYVPPAAFEGMLFELEEWEPEAE
jgi:hypothetical protein